MSLGREVLLCERMETLGLRINPSSSMDLLLSTPLASIKTGDSLTTIILNCNFLIVSSAMLTSPGHVFIGNWRAELKSSGPDTWWLPGRGAGAFRRRAPIRKQIPTENLSVCAKSSKQLCFWAVSVLSLSRVRLYATPWTAACQASLYFTTFQNLFKFITNQPSHPLLLPSPPAFTLSQHQGLFQWVGSSN